jgi:protein-S-isoprenylcysteine O-methyltransferase Ste14
LCEEELMRATDWEFRNRFWVYLVIFTFAFSCYTFDGRNVVDWAAHAIRGATHRGDGVSEGVYHLVFFAAAALAALGAMLRTWATAYLRTEVVHDSALHDERLVADGPYRHLRNPLYVGLMLTAVGMAAMANRIGAALILVVIPFFTLRLIGREEAALTASGGESYRAFCAAVPRLLPSLAPRLPAGGTAPHWGQAVAGETFFWALALAIAVFAATLRMQPFYYVLGSAFVLRWALAVLWWRRRAGRPAIE